MGSQRSSESTSYNGSGQRWATPFARNAATAVTNAYNANQPIMDNAIGRASGLGDSLAANYDAGNAQSAQARAYLGDVLSGRYLNSNPYLEGMIGQTRTGVTDAVNSNFALAGRYGSGAHTGVLSRELANAENQMRFNDYGQQMSRMDNAAALQGQLNSSNAQQALAATGLQGEMPWNGMQAYANSLGALFNGGTQRSVTYAPSPIWGAIGAGLGAAGMAMSARSLKKDIVEVGTLPNGLTVYDFRYKNDPAGVTYRGVMADEVKDKVPEAYIENLDGKGNAGVNYALVGMPLMKVAA